MHHAPCCSRAPSANGTSCRSPNEQLGSLPTGGLTKREGTLPALPLELLRRPRVGHDRACPSCSGRDRCGTPSTSSSSLHRGAWALDGMYSLHVDVRVASTSPHRSPEHTLLLCPQPPSSGPCRGSASPPRTCAAAPAATPWDLGPTPWAWPLGHASWATP